MFEDAEHLRKTQKQLPPSVIEPEPGLRCPERERRGSALWVGSLNILRLGLSAFVLWLG